MPRQRQAPAEVTLHVTCAEASTHAASYPWQQLLWSIWLMERGSAIHQGITRGSFPYLLMIPLLSPLDSMCDAAAIRLYLPQEEHHGTCSQRVRGRQPAGSPSPQMACPSPSIGVSVSYRWASQDLAWPGPPGTYTPETPMNPQSELAAQGCGDGAWAASEVSAALEGDAPGASLVHGESTP